MKCVILIRSANGCHIILLRYPNVGFWWITPPLGGNATPFSLIVHAVWRIRALILCFGVFTKQDNLN